MKKLLSVLLAAVMIVTLSSSAIFAAPNNNPNASFNREKSSFENKVKNKTMNEGELEALREQIRIAMISGEGLNHGLTKRMELPPGLAMLLDRGTLPHGIVKKLLDNYYPLPGKKTDFEALKALIETADAKADAAVPTEYKNGVVVIAKFRKAIADAEKFVEEYDETKKIQIKTEIDDLKAAMKEFDDAKYVDKLVEVEVILDELEDYKDAYYNILSVDKKGELDSLIVFITTILDAEMITKGDFDKIIKDSKAFSDPLTLLYVNLEIAEEFLKEDEDDYLPGSHDKLEIAIVNVKGFLAGKTTSALILIVEQVEEHNENLEEAIEIFKDSELLGEAELAVLEQLMAALIEIRSESYSYNLNKLINKIDEYVDEEKVLTVGVYYEILEASKVYIVNLYVYLDAELDALIEDAEDAILDSENAVAIDDLEDLIDEINAYLAADELVYEEMVAYYNELVEAINEL